MTEIMVMVTPGAAPMIAAITAKVMKMMIVVAKAMAVVITAATMMATTEMAAAMVATVTAATQIRTEQNWNRKGFSVQYSLQLTPPHLS